VYTSSECCIYVCLVFYLLILLNTGEYLIVKGRLVDEDVTEHKG
jgi:hypothetical protein